MIKSLKMLHLFYKIYIDDVAATAIIEYVYVCMYAMRGYYYLIIFASYVLKLLYSFDFNQSYCRQK